MTRRQLMMLGLVIILIVIVIGCLIVFYLESEQLPPDKVLEEKAEELENLEEIKKACSELGCPPGSIYVGSKNSDKYYFCNCHYAKLISPENIVCFKSEQEAIGEGRERSEC